MSKKAEEMLWQLGGFAFAFAITKLLGAPTWGAVLSGWCLAHLMLTQLRD